MTFKRANSKIVLPYYKLIVLLGQGFHLIQWNRTQMQIYNWNEYLKLSAAERESNWIIDSHGIDWVLAEKKEDDNLFNPKWFQAEQISPDAKVIIIKEFEILKSTPEPNFYLKFFMLDFEAPETIKDFMITYGFNYGQYVMRDSTSKSLLFTVDDLRVYHEDFKKNLIGSLHQTGKLSADIVKEKIRQENEVVDEYKKKTGKNYTWWEGETMRMTDSVNQINRHLRRCYPQLDVKQTPNGGKPVLSRRVVHPDLIGLIYLQLNDQILSEQKIEECQYCKQIFTYTGRKRKYCGPECKKTAESKRRWDRIKNDPKKLEEHRKKNREFWKEHKKSQI